MGDVGEVAGAVKSISDLVGGLLDRADRDSLSKTLQANQDEIQNAFANNDLDAEWRAMYRLYTDVGHPPTPGGAVGETDREYRHNSLFIAAELKYAKDIIARLVSLRTQK